MDRKEENIDEIEPKFVFDDMADDMKKLALSCAHSAYKVKMEEEKYFKDIAMNIKAEFTKKFEGTWHVIVGTEFGSYVSYEQNTIIFFWIKHIGFLIFRHG